MRYGESGVVLKYHFISLFEQCFEVSKQVWDFGYTKLCDVLAQHWQSVAAVKIGTRQETGVRVSPTTRLLERSWIGLDLEIYGDIVHFLLFRSWAHNVVGTQQGPQQTRRTRRSNLIASLSSVRLDQSSICFLLTLRSIAPFVQSHAEWRET